MITIKIEFPDQEKVLNMIRQAPQKSLAELSVAVEKSVKKIHSNAVKEAPVNKGAGGGKQGYGGSLRQSISSKMTTKLSGEINVDAPYAGYVEKGTAPHIIVPVRKKVLANVYQGKIFGKRVKHPGTKKNPFMERSIKKSETAVNGYFKNAMERILKSLKA